ncbi:hypothetical protein SAMN05444338_10274 [Flavobacterium degerlachei]|uniref:Uncharacterized protein n=1 Tax=Flavobacterium degerlachei TaxID=229203 RepID=A0A1H2SI90_9FLAO|nr:hypothetical protein SAMN05444338_10274 [Flavobacterium degerlachei]
MKNYELQFVVFLCFFLKVGLLGFWGFQSRKKNFDIAY